MLVTIKLFAGFVLPGCACAIMVGQGLLEDSFIKLAFGGGGIVATWIAVNWLRDQFEGLRQDISDLETRITVIESRK